MLKRLAALAVAVIALFAVATSPGSAQEDQDNEALQENVVTTTSCTEGVLSDDGQYCIVPRLDNQPVPAGAGDSATTDGAAAPIPAFTG